MRWKNNQDAIHTFPYRKKNYNECEVDRNGNDIQFFYSAIYVEPILHKWFLSKYQSHKCCWRFQKPLMEGKYFLCGIFVICCHVSKSMSFVMGRIEMY